jgi:hypothetical protein
MLLFILSPSDTIDNNGMHHLPQIPLTCLS